MLEPSQRGAVGQVLPWSPSPQPTVWASPLPPPPPPPPPASASAPPASRLVATARLNNSRINAELGGAEPGKGGTRDGHTGKAAPPPCAPTSCAPPPPARTRGPEMEGATASWGGPPGKLGTREQQPGSRSRTATEPMGTAWNPKICPTGGRGAFCRYPLSFSIWRGPQASWGQRVRAVGRTPAPPHIQPGGEGWESPKNS